MSALPLPQALALLKTLAIPVAGTERVALDQSLGRVLAEPIIAGTPLPRFDHAAVDGWAYTAGTTAPLILPGRAAAGHPFAGRVAPGHAIRILTGAPLPTGTDTVAMQEAVTAQAGRLRLPAELAAGSNRRRAGEDLAEGAMALAAGTLLRPPHLALAAALGLAELLVRRPLRIALLSVGDELATPDTALRPAMIWDSNRPLLRAMLGNLPGVVTDLGILADRPDIIRTALHDAAAQHDAIVTTGGASQGDEDHVVALVRQMGRLDLRQVAIKPGRPFACGRIGQAAILCLPGSPAAALVSYLRLARPLLLAMAGAEWPEPAPLLLPSGFALPWPGGRTGYLRARLAADAEGRSRVVRAGSDDAVLSGLAAASGLVELLPDQRDLAAGDLLRYFPFHELGMP